MKLCKDCKWYQRDWWGHNIMRTDSYDKCLRPNKSNYVSGKTKAFIKLQGFALPPLHSVAGELFYV